MFRKYVLTFCLAVISCVATKTIQGYTEVEEYTVHDSSVEMTSANVIHIMYEMKLI